MEEDISQPEIQSECQSSQLTAFGRRAEGNALSLIYTNLL